MLPGFDAKPLKRSTKRLAQRASEIPTGMMFPYGGSVAPEGYALCNGQALSRTKDAALFAVIGTTFGAGDGSTTFNVPNPVDRMLIGAGNLYALGATGGSKDAVVVAHTHTASTSIIESPHAHGGGEYDGVNNLAAGGLGVHARFSGAPRSGNTDTNSTGITASTTVNSNGVSGTNANLPPYLGVNFIIKT